MARSDLKIRQTIAGVVTDTMQRMVIPLYRDCRNRPEQIGSGFFLNVNGHSILVSAAHVIDRLRVPETLYYYVEPSRIRKVTGRVWITKENDLGETSSDIGIVFLHEDPLPPYPGVDKHIVPLQYAAPGRAPRPGKHYLIAGFPASKNKSNPVGKYTEAIVYAYHDFSAEAEVYESLGLAQESHIVMPLDRKKGLNPDGTHSNFPKPNGMSGSPIWEVFDSNDDSDQPFHLVGVGVEYRHSSKLLIGTDISSVLRLAGE